MSWRRDDRSQRILEDLAGWAAMYREPRNARYDRERALLQMVLFDAATIHFYQDTQHMNAERAAKWIQNKCEAMIKQREVAA